MNQSVDWFSQFGLMHHCLVEQAMGELGILSVEIKKGEIPKLTSVLGCNFSSPLSFIES